MAKELTKLMELIDFNLVKKNTRRYSGNAGNKYGVKFNDENWMIKFPRTTIPFSTSPLSEFLGSTIYKILGVEVHQVKLGVKKSESSARDKLVVACRDFLEPGVRLIEFKETKNAQFFKDGSEGTSGAGTNLNEVLETIEISDDFSGFRDEVRERFWDMFVIDFVIGNNDRNNTNWGILATDEEIFGLAPVYDNGNAFFNKRSMAQFEKRIEDENALKEDAYGTLVSAFLDDEGMHIHPAEVISSMAYKDCNAAVARFVANFKLEEIEALFAEIPVAEKEVMVFPQRQKAFYLKLIEKRVEDVILPAFGRL